MIRVNPKYIPLLATAVVLLAVFGSGSLLYPNFGTPRVLVNLLNDSAFVGVAAVGESFVILSGGIDLSVGSMVAFVGILIAKLLQAGCEPLLAMGVAVCVGTVSGAGMGCLIYLFELPPFLVTLAGLFCLRGLGFVINPESIGIDHPFYGQVLPELSILVAPKAALPFTAMCFLASIIIGTLLASFTRFGRNVYAIGSNENSARLMGLPLGRTKIMTYALAGCFSALGGVVATFYMQSGNPASFVGLELDAIASVVIGGTLLTVELASFPARSWVSSSSD
jgi:galactofuranose transport system permease protein